MLIDLEETRFAIQPYDLLVTKDYYGALYQATNVTGNPLSKGTHLDLYYQKNNKPILISELETDSTAKFKILLKISPQLQLLVVVQREINAMTFDLLSHRLASRISTVKLPIIKGDELRTLSFLFKANKFEVLFDVGKSRVPGRNI